MLTRERQGGRVLAREERKDINKGGGREEKY